MGSTPPEGIQNKSGSTGGYLPALSYPCLDDYINQISVYRDSMLEPRDEARLSEHFGTFIFRLRETQGLTVRDAASRMGLTHSRLLNFEHGKDPHTGKPTLPSAEVVVRIAQAYGYPKDRLLILAGYLPWLVDEPAAEGMLEAVQERLGGPNSP